MAVPAFIERVTHEDPDGSRRLSGHDWESAVECIHGGTLTVATFKAAINATADDETDIDNLIALVTDIQANQLDERNQMVMTIKGTIAMAHLGYWTAATARTKLGIATP